MYSTSCVHVCTHAHVCSYMTLFRLSSIEWLRLVQSHLLMTAVTATYIVGTPLNATQLNVDCDASSYVIQAIQDGFADF